MGQTTSNPAEDEYLDNLETILREHSEAALEHFKNQNGGKRYEFVEQGPSKGTATYPKFDQLYFKAKEKDRPSAPVETFLAQLSFVPDMRVDSCVSLGPNQEYPKELIF